MNDLTPNQTTVINRITYTVISVQDIGHGASRVTLETKNKTRKTALFFGGAFDVWESAPKKSNKFSRVNMRK